MITVRNFSVPRFDFDPVGEDAVFEGHVFLQIATVEVSQDCAWRAICDEVRERVGSSVRSGRSFGDLPSGQPIQIDPTIAGITGRVRRGTYEIALAGRCDDRSARAEEGARIFVGEDDPAWKPRFDHRDIARRLRALGYEGNPCLAFALLLEEGWHVSRGTTISFDAGQETSEWIAPTTPPGFKQCGRGRGSEDMDAWKGFAYVNDGFTRRVGYKSLNVSLLHRVTQVAFREVV